MKAWERDAEEFGLHVRQGGWRLGLLVARNVEKGTGGPRVTDARTSVTKVSAREFGERAKTSSDRVMRHLRAWDAAAEQGHVPPSSELKPNTELDLDAEKLPDWAEFYPPVTGGYNGGKTRTPTKQSVADTLGKLDEDAQAEIIAGQLGRSDPKLAKKVAKDGKAFVNMSRAVTPPKPNRPSAEPTEPTLISLVVKISDAQFAIDRIMAGWSGPEAIDPLFMSSTFIDIANRALAQKERVDQLREANNEEFAAIIAGFDPRRP